MKYHEKRFKKKERNVKNIVLFHSLHSVFISLMTSTASTFTPSHLHRTNPLFYFQHAVNFVFGSNPTPHQRSDVMNSAVVHISQIVGQISSLLKCIEYGNVVHRLPGKLSIFPNFRNFLRSSNLCLISFMLPQLSVTHHQSPVCVKSYYINGFYCQVLISLGDSFRISWG